MHPLRPQEGGVIVCEGNDDAVFLNNTLSKYLNDLNLSIFHAQGSSNVRLLANVLEPSVYILDRDFNIEYKQAEDSLVNTSRFTAWKRHEIESYLIYPDWLFQVAMDAYDSSKLYIRNLPNNEEAIRQQIQDIANELIFDHAGRKTLAIMSRQLNSDVSFHYKSNSRIVSSGAESSNQQDWETLLLQENIRIQDALTLATKVSLENVMDEFHRQIEFYHTVSDTFDLLQQEFSGKRIIQMLAPKWNLGGGKGKPWQVIQRGLLNYARDYAHSQEGFLSDDGRLGDVGLLARKVLGTKI